MKPKIKFENGLWLCGGFPVGPWYVDWFAGATPAHAYKHWERNK